MCDSIAPSISVVMSVYNCEKYLAQSIESILNQTFTDFEFIIVDDGSTDDSLSIIQRYSEEDDRIVIMSRKNKGLPFSLNEGIAFSKGKYIARMDADDISLPRRLKLQHEVLEAKPEVGVCGGSAYLFNQIPNKKRLMSNPQMHEELKVRLLFSVCFIHPTVMIRADCLKAMPYIYDVNFQNSQDYELWSRLVEVTTFYNIKTPLIYYRSSSDGITAKVGKDALNNRFPLVAKIHEKQLSKIGYFSSNEDLMLHFHLSLNSGMANIGSSADCVKSYLKRIISANNLSGYLNDESLICFLSRKYFVFLVLSFRQTKNITFSCFFDSMFLLGGFRVCKDKLLSRLRAHGL